MRIFATHFTFCSLVLSAVAVIVSAIVAHAQSAADPIVVSKELTFSWEVVVMIVVSASGYAATVYSIRDHIRRGDIHLTREEIAEEHPRRLECKLIHQRVDEEIARLDKTG